MDKHLKKFEKLYKGLVESEYLTFSTIATLKKLTGVYVIYAPDNAVLYIGSTGNFNVRFGTDLKHEATHTLVKKWLRDGVFTSRAEAVDFLMNKCKYRIRVCDDKREAEAVEHYAIWVLEPRFNS